MRRFPNLECRKHTGGSGSVSSLFTCSDGLSPQWLSPATVTYLMPLYPTRLCVSLSGSSLPAPAPKPSSGKSQAVTRNSASVPTIVETTVLLREIRCRGHRDGRDVSATKDSSSATVPRQRRGQGQSTVSPRNRGRGTEGLSTRPQLRGAQA